MLDSKIWRRRCWLLASAALLSACASTDYGTRAAGDRPSDLTSTEASLWYQMDNAEADLRRSGSVVDDPELAGFVSGVLCNVSGDHCDDLNVYVVRNAEFNAFMAPNGMSAVYTGLLLRAEDESQLAAVLAHEFVHFEENHTLEMLGAARNARMTGMVLGVAVGAVGGPMALGDLAAAGGFLSFSREKETEADIKGMRYMAGAGYNAGSASLIWQNLQDELEASGFDRRRRSAGNTGFFDTHPGVEDRIGELNMRAAEFVPVDTDPVAYRAMIRPFLQDWLDDEIVRRDPERTLHLIERLSALEMDMGVLEYARGRILALRDDEGDQALAREAFLTSIEHDDAPALSWRGLAEIERANGQNQSAADAYEAYLSRAPDAADAALVERLIEDLRG